MTRSGRLLLGTGLALTLTLASVLALQRGKATDPAVEAGKALFTGNVALKAHMVGHDTDLPPAAVRCANCHSRQAAPPGAAAPTAASARPRDIYAAPLSYAALLEKRPRRGGPPSRYDLAAFCRVLRDGIDPASVMVAQTMPRYRLTEQECHELWTFAISH